MENQQVTVRRLPDGDAYLALSPNRLPNHPDGQIVHIDLSLNSPEADLKAGDLVEVTSPQYLYLGEVVGRKASSLIVGVEHKLDREVLAVIQQVWRGPDSE